MADEDTLLEANEPQACNICGGRVDHRHVFSEPMLPDGPLTSYEVLKQRNKVMAAALVKLSGLTEDQFAAVTDTIRDTAGEKKAIEGDKKRQSSQSAASNSTDQPKVPDQRGKRGEGVRELGHTESPVDGESSKVGEPDRAPPA